MSINIINLSKAYAGNEILKNVSVHFEKGRKYLIEGENGIGKSTLIRAILRQVRFKGEIEVQGRISYQPEEAVLPAFMTMQVFLETVSTLSGKDPDVKKAIDSYLRIFGINEKRKAFIGSLSKGQKQKVNVIQALVTPSEILLLDEPFSGLDKESKRKLSEILGKEKRLVIVISHETSEISLEGFKRLELKGSEMIELPETH